MVKKKKRANRAKTKIKRKTRPATRKVKKAKVTRARSKKAKKGPKPSPVANLEKVGEVTHYFPKVKAAAVMVLKDSLKVGDAVYIKGHTTDFKEKVASMQLDHAPIQEGKKGDEIGLLVKSRVRIGDGVYRI